MRIEERIKRAVEAELEGRPSYEDAWENVHRRARRRQHAKAFLWAGAGVAAALALGAILMRGGEKPSGITSEPSLSSTGCVPTCHQLVWRKNMPAPVSDATGITFDGHKLWVMGGHHTLTEVDPKTDAIGRQYPLADLEETAGTGVFGITWDGSDIWISVSGNTNKLVRVNPDNGSIVATYSSPTWGGSSDLDFDGKDIWLSSGLGDAFRLDRATAGIKSHFRTWPDHHVDNGIAVRGTRCGWEGGLAACVSKMPRRARS